MSSVGRASAATALRMRIGQSPCWRLRQERELRAEARVEGDRVVVRSPAVPEPKAVRYAWQANPVATLFNREGFPAAPFRTDDWPGSTDGNR